MNRRHKDGSAWTADTFRHGRISLISLMAAMSDSHAVASAIMSNECGSTVTAAITKVAATIRISSADGCAGAVIGLIGDGIEHKSYSWEIQSTRDAFKLLENPPAPK